MRIALCSASTAGPVEPRRSTVFQWGRSGCTASSRAAHVLASTTPVTVSRRADWNDFTAAAVAGPKRPSTTTPPRPRWSTLTAVPVEPTASVVDFTAVNSVVGAGTAAGAAAVVLGAAISAFQTLASVMPVTVRPLDFWY